MEALSCYLFIHLDHIPFIRTSLSLTFYFITRILFLSPARPRRSSSRSGIWIFLRLQISLWTLILNFDLLHEILLPCCVLTCFLLNSRSLPFYSTLYLLNLINSEKLLRRFHDCLSFADYLIQIFSNRKSCAFISVIELPRIPAYCPKTPSYPH